MYFLNFTPKELQKRGMTVLNHDRYYKDIPHPKGFNFDEPNALDNALLISHIEKLKRGMSIEAPIYDFPTHSRSTDTERIDPKPHILIEGILTLAVPEIQRLADLCLFVEAPDDIRLIRRLQRDVLYRGRNVEEVLQQYLHTVRPMHLLHIAPTKSMADLVLDGPAPVSPLPSCLLTQLQNIKIQGIDVYDVSSPRAN